jgi:hypothetical protein
LTKREVWLVINSGNQYFYDTSERSKDMARALLKVSYILGDGRVTHYREFGETNTQQLKHEMSFHPFTARSHRSVRVLCYRKAALVHFPRPE